MKKQNAIYRVLQNTENGGQDLPDIYASKAANILGLHIHTFNKWVERGIIKPRDHDPLGHNLFDLDQIVALKAKINPKKKPGIAAFQKFDKRFKKG